MKYQFIYASLLIIQNTLLIPKMSWYVQITPPINLIAYYFTERLMSNHQCKKSLKSWPVLQILIWIPRVTSFTAVIFNYSMFLSSHLLPSEVINDKDDKTNFTIGLELGHQDQVVCAWIHCISNSSSFFLLFLVMRSLWYLKQHVPLKNLDG